MRHPRVVGKTALLALLPILGIPAAWAQNWTVDLSTGQENVLLFGRAAQDQTGYSVALGDVNGDGKKDIIFGIPFSDIGTANGGAVGIMLGSAALPSFVSLDLNSFNPDILIKGGAAGAQLGWSVASADINADSIEDVIIGSNLAAPSGKTNAGEVLVIYGSASWTTGTVLDLASVTPNIRIQGAMLGGRLGQSVASGDFNGDTIKDLLMGANLVSNPNGGATILTSGAAYVVYGSNSFPVTLVKDLATSPADITLYGPQANDDVGWAVAAGNLNASGPDDMVVSGFFADGPSARTNCGGVFAVMGSSSFPATTVIPLSSGAQFSMYGGTTYDYLGRSLATGDVNGDGYADLLAGATQADSAGRLDAGEGYVIYGGPSFPVTNLWDLKFKNPDIRVMGQTAGDNLGESAAILDIRGDGIKDFFLGAPQADPGGRSGAGNIYGFYGSASFPVTHVINLATTQPSVLISGSGAGDQAGWSLAAGDFGSDTIEDLALGANVADSFSRTDSGEAYIVYGKVDATPTPTVTRTQSATFTDSRTFSPTFTDSPTPTPTPTFTNTLTFTSTATFSPTRTDSPTATSTSTASPTKTDSPTSTFSPTSSPTRTETPTATPSMTASVTLTLSPSATLTTSPSSTPTSTATSTDTATVTATSSGTFTATGSPTATNSPTPTSTISPSSTRSPTQSATFTNTVYSLTVSATDSPTPTATATNTASPTRTGTSTATATGTGTATTTGTATITLTSTGTATPTASSTATASPTSSGTDTRTATPSSTATPGGTDTPTPSRTETATAAPTSTGTWTATQALSPTVSSTVTPTASPVFSPTSTSTVTATRTPTSISTPEGVQAWPNPFDPLTAAGGEVKIGPLLSGDRVEIFSVSGERVVVLDPDAGGLARWDAKNTGGSPVVGGLYFYVVVRGGKAVSRGKIGLLR